ncbi:hypothetical protein [Micromonospora sp. WMMD1082]|uniref:hypothetical protein n=1 Tax=Micromonospora sp. WMMD1082 TaxID=3016104 RepID=UPI0024160046|nr:hypothetical protein [Micromonospora sp. WMMD1082]MDG4795389.1 hypothetical protein [Micromonospora sp. WMMD1082]
MELVQMLAAAADQGPTRADWLAAWAGLLAAVGTVGTFVWQARALSRERETRREEVKRLEADQRDAQDAQARTIVLHNPGCGGNQRVSVRDYGVTLGNYGVHPITNIRTTLTHRETQQDLTAGGPQPLPVLKAGDMQHLSWKVDGYNVVWPPDLDHHDLPNLFHCEVAFTDVNGVRWMVRPGLGQQPSRVFDF